MFGNDAEALVSFWANHDQCMLTPSSIDTFPHISGDSLRVVHYVYPNGAYGSDVEFYKVLGGAHQWLGPAGDDVNYALEIWKFFRRYRWEPQTATGINDMKNAVGVTVYPNPAVNELNVRLDAGISNNFCVSLMDIAGRPVYTGKGSGNISINTASFASGVYTVSIIADGQKLTRKVCISE
jgi:hypothetical protein